MAILFAGHRPGPWLRVGLRVVISLSLLTSCAAPDAPKSRAVLRSFTSEKQNKLFETPQCKSMLDNYCNLLYSPEALGNLEVKNKQNSIKILQGETHNQFSQVFYRYSQAKIQNQKSLPKDFTQVLLRNTYFIKLKNFLERPPRTLMSEVQRLHSEELDFELNYLWTSAFNETVISRMNIKYPGYYKLPDNLVPIELQLERRRQRRRLISDISQALWRHDRNWKKVEKGFTNLQQSYLKMIARLDIPDEIRQGWAVKIKEIKLVMPGAVQAISNEECSSTTANAYYYPYLNLLTVCAGDFNSEDIMQTLAHEMGHALGIDRAQYLFAFNSEFGKKLSNFRQQVCKPKSFTCQAWTEFKEQFSPSLQSLNGFNPELPKFQRCLKRRETNKSLDDDNVTRYARNFTSDRISQLASTDRFLRVTKSELPTPNGKTQQNPNYLNPCSYYLWSQGEEPIDDEITTMIFFTAEYRCSDKPKSMRMKEAIDMAKTMTQQVIEKTIRIEGEYSARSVLETEGYSSPPFERFADVLGSYALAQLLSEVPTATERQNRFLASSSWQCLEPSLASHYPEESSVENEYIFDPHTEGDQRRKELFSAPIREVIACKKDFEFKECSLPFKTPITPTLGTTLQSAAQ